MGQNGVLKKFASAVVPVSIILASVMNSTNYSIQTDSLNFAGDISSSTSYSMNQTLGEVATGVGTSTNYRVYAGYQNMQESFISITASPNASMPALAGLGGGTSVGTSSWTVITDNIAGYSLSIRATSSPALQSPDTGASFADYSPAAAPVPDYQFSIDSTSSAFGFSPEGVDIVQKYLDDAGDVGVCNVYGGYDTADRCWGGLSTSTQTIAQRSSGNQPNGSTTTVKYKAQIGAQKIQDSGSYSATIIVTAVTL